MNATKSSTILSARSISPTTPLLDFRGLLLEALNDRWRTFRAELKRCQKKYSEAAVHDLRVATRRLIATLDLVVSVDPQADLRKARRALKRQLGMFGPLRDVQVQSVSIDKMLAKFPKLQSYYDSLMSRERKLVQRLGADIKRVKSGKLEKAIRTAVKRLDVLLDTPERQQEKRAEAIRAVEAAFNRVVERKQAVDPTDSATIHRMRVAFKKFRYMIESLAPMLDRGTSKRLKAMNAFQGDMGDIQDAEVLLTGVVSFARKRGAASEASLAAALQELSDRRAALIEAFLGSADTVYTFWKPMA
ncbi:MAG TPA: CHAD domain-containing protein [Candidatus Tectomicrobia bacterium]|nr:CHAD domain-containing protein [Candidatus Tectomicrobia bacterium]